MERGRTGVWRRLRVYDADGRIVRSIAPPGEPDDAALVTATAYDAAGRPTAVTVNQITSGSTTGAATNLVTSYTYDDLGRQTDLTRPWGVGGTATTVTTRSAYDRLGQLTATTLDYVDGTWNAAYPDEDVRSTFAYDAIGELVGYCPAVQVNAGCSAGDPASSRAWHYAYDAAGHLAGQTPPVNQTLTPLAETAWSYDAGGRLTTVCDYDAGASCSGISRWRYTTYGYDGVGRLTDAATSSVNRTSGAETLRLDVTTAYDGDGRRTQVSDGSDTVTFSYDSLDRPNQVKRGTTVLADFDWNGDGTLNRRRDGDDGAIGWTSFTSDRLDRLTALSSPLYTSGSPGFSWRMDDLLAGRTWPGTTNTATVAYDAAKRPTAFTEQRSGSDQAVFTQAYDRGGNVVSEGRTLSGITGNAGTGTQDFTYDKLNRVLSGTLGGAGTAYTYDADGNRLTSTAGGVTTTDTYDRADQLKTRKVGTGAAVSFAYDARGNLTSNAESGSTVTASAYDWADRLVSIDPPGASNTVAFTFDALGRNATRTVNGALDSTYFYLGTSETVVRLAVNGGATTNAALDALGQRIAVKAGDGSFFGWLLPDLHGNVAAALSQDETTVSDGLRYDAYGQLAAIYPTGGTGVSAQWRYQGRLLISTSGNADLYDFSARSYSPGLAAFTQLDTVMGGAANPLSMNRYLYAEANPATLIDPTGHGTKGDSGNYRWRQQQANPCEEIWQCWEVPGGGGTGGNRTATGQPGYDCPSSICNPTAATVTTTSTAPDYTCDAVCYEQAQRLDFLAALNEPFGLISPMNQQTALVARIAEYALLSGDFEGANQMMQDLILMDVIPVEIAVTVVTAIPTEGLSVPAMGTVISGTAQRLGSARERLASMLQGLPQRLTAIGQRLAADERGEIRLGGLRQVAYGSTDLSRLAMRARLDAGMLRTRNTAVFEYQSGEGLEIALRFSARGVGHAERLLWQELEAAGVKPQQVTRIYSELQPCRLPGGYCSDWISRTFPNADVTWSFPYGTDAASRAAGIDALVEELSKLGR